MKQLPKIQKTYLWLLLLWATILLSCTITTQAQSDTPSAPTNLTLGKTFTQTWKQGTAETDYISVFTYTFTPKYTGKYSFDIYGDYVETSLYTKSGTVVSPVYYWETNFDCYELTKNVTYTYQVTASTYWENSSFNITPKKYFSVSLTENNMNTYTPPVIAVGTTKTLKLDKADFAANTKWKSSKTSVAAVSSKGVITAKKSGTATITVSGKDLYGEAYSDKLTITVSNPKLSASSLSLNLYNAYRSDSEKIYYCTNNMITVRGMKEYSTINVTSISKNLKYDYYGNDMYFYPKKAGSYTVKITIDGKKFTFKVYARKLYFSRNSKTIADGVDANNWSKTWIQNQSMLALYKGESVTLNIKGKTSNSKVKYKSSNKSVAAINSKGKVTAKGLGYATITATVDNINITYEVGVSYKTAIQALRYAAKYYGSTYSQSKRMQTGYYDCSSYVWRSYASAKKYLQTKSYAPTAADLAKWCNSNGYMISSGTVDINKLLPGDLIFWIGTNNNGRYRNIYHVEMYQGMNRAITVNSQRYYSDTSSEIMIARPCDTTAGGLKVTTSGKKKLKLSWSSEFGANGYQIYRSTSKNGKYTKIATVKNAKTYIDTSVKSKKTYYYKVRAYWKSSEKTYYSKYSSIVSKKVK